MTETAELPKAVWSGTVFISDVPLKFHVLENGQRIIEVASMQQLFEAWANGAQPASQNEVDQMMAWLTAKNPGG